MTDDKVGWFNRLLDLLPAQLRPKHDNQRFRDACARAYANGWTPDQLAEILNRLNYTHAVSPPSVLIVELERVGERPPPRRSGAVRNGGCIVCPPAQRCTHPVTERDRIPSDWLAERMDLLRELARSPDLTEDEREQAMADLIRHQRGRAAWSTSE